MGKNIEHKKATDEQGLSDQEIWWKIRYLDPDIKRSDSVVTITVAGHFGDSWRRRCVALQSRIVRLGSEQIALRRHRK